MLVDRLFVSEKGFRALSPRAVEHGTLQHLQVFAGHFVLPVDEIGLGQALQAACTLAQVGQSLHRFECETLRGVHQSEVEINLAGELCAGEIALERRQQTFVAALIELEGAVAQLSGHGQCEVGCRHAHGQIGHLLLRFGNDALPVLHANEVVVLNELVFLRIETARNPCDGAQDNENQLSHDSHYSTFRLQMGGQETRSQRDEHAQDGRDNHRHGEDKHEPVVAQTHHQAVERIVDKAGAQQYAGQSVQYQTAGNQRIDGFRLAVEDQTQGGIDGKHPNEGSGKPVNHGDCYDGVEDLQHSCASYLTLCGVCLVLRACLSIVLGTRPAQHGQHAAQQRHDESHQDALIAQRVPQRQGGEKAERIVNVAARKAVCRRCLLHVRPHQQPCEHLHQHEENGHDGSSEQDDIVELDQKLGHVAGKTARHGQQFLEIRRACHEQLELFLIGQGVRILHTPKQKDHYSEQ